MKLYFMIGLPTELDEDIEGLVELCNKISEITRRNKGNLKNVNISISSFVPKPHTPFQWVGQNEPGELKRKQRLLQKKLRHNIFTVRFHKAELSLLEAIMSRGDRRLSRVVKEARQLGCSFDGWTESFDFSKWEKAFARSGLNESFYAHRQLDKDEILPWSHIDLQVDQEILWKEYEKALKAEFSGDCFEVGCLECGPCVRKKLQTSAQPVVISSPIKYKAQPRERIRLDFEKIGFARFLSHLELIRVFWRALRRAGIPLAYSAGFHPHPLIIFGPALPVGIESLNEIVDLQLSSYLAPEIVLKKLRDELPQGLKPHRAVEIPLRSPAPSEIINKVTYIIKPGKSFNSFSQLQLENIIDKIKNFKKPGLESLQADGGSSNLYAIRSSIEELQLTRSSKDSFQILLTLKRPEQGKGIKPWQVLELIFPLKEDDFLSWRITKV